MFLKKTGFLRHPQRSECAARLGIRDRKAGFFRLATELRGAGKWKNKESKNNRKPNPMSPFPASSALFCPSHIPPLFCLDIRCPETASNRRNAGRKAKLGCQLDDPSMEINVNTRTG